MNIYQKDAVLDKYDKDDLGADPIFQGNFINFGYWKDFDLERGISIDQRVQASKALYQIVFDQFLSRENLVVAEIGCGRGLGCRLLSENPRINSIIGIDLNDQQVERARQLHSSLIESKPDRIRFQQGSASNTGLNSNSLDVVYTVEASQHFPSLPDFLREVQRILKPGGDYALTTFFATHKGVENELTLKQRFTTIDAGVDFFRLLEEMKSECTSSGLELVYEQSIGQDVFFGFDKWMSQLNAEDQQKWVSDLLRSFEEGLIDYNVLVFKKPSC